MKHNGGEEVPADSAGTTIKYNEPLGHSCLASEVYLPVVEVPVVLLRRRKVGGPDEDTVVSGELNVALTCTSVSTDAWIAIANDDHAFELSVESASRLKHAIDMILHQITKDPWK